MVDRLTCDPQMEAVWTQLLQKSRTTGGFRLAANLMTMVGRKRANEIHPASTTVVFRDAVTFGLECLQFAEQKRTHYLEQAKKSVQMRAPWNGRSPNVVRKISLREMCTASQINSTTQPMRINCLLIFLGSGLT